MDVTFDGGSDLENINIEEVGSVLQAMFIIPAVMNP